MPHFVNGSRRQAFCLGSQKRASSRPADAAAGGGVAGETAGRLPTYRASSPWSARPWRSVGSPVASMPAARRRAWRLPQARLIDPLKSLKAVLTQVTDQRWLSSPGSHEEDLREANSPKARPPWDHRCGGDHCLWACRVDFGAWQHIKPAGSGRRAFLLPSFHQPRELSFAHL